MYSDKNQKGRSQFFEPACYHVGVLFHNKLFCGLLSRLPFSSHYLVNCVPLDKSKVIKSGNTNLDSYYTNGRVKNINNKKHASCLSSYHKSNQILFVVSQRASHMPTELHLNQSMPPQNLVPVLHCSCPPWYPSSSPSQQPG